MTKTKAFFFIMIQLAILFVIVHIFIKQTFAMFSLLILIICYCIMMQTVRTVEKKVPMRIPVEYRIRQQVFERDNYRCVFCGRPDDLQIDHKFPVSKGGTNDIDNLQTLCKYCNQKKRDKV